MFNSVDQFLLGGITAALSEGVSGCSQLVDNHIENLGDLEEGQAGQTSGHEQSRSCSFFATKNGEITEALFEGVCGHSLTRL